MNDNLPYYLGFSYFPGIGPMRFDAFLARFGNVKEAFEASSSHILSTLGPALGGKFITFRSSFDFETEYHKLIAKKITVVTREDVHFPPQFHELPDTPICLYVKGDIANVNWSEDFFFAVVGTRKPTEYGKQITKKFARELAKTGVVIVSGMAMGIDGIAHWEALHEGKRTIAFLGCGVNIIYPWTNRDLYHRIIDSGSLIISEFPPDKTTIKGHFVARNRLISGLSRGVLVTEGLINSGSLITARYALAQGKDVFAPPSPITSHQSQAPNLLLKEGAVLVTDVEDILEEYGLKQKEIITQKLKLLPEEQKQLYQLLCQEAFTPDELARSVRAPISQVLTLVSTMEISGIVEKNEQGKYQIRV